MELDKIKRKRFYYMQYDSKKRGKEAPTLEQLELMLSKLDNMKCPHCGVTMCWLIEESMKNVITIQHYKDGSMGLICATCNKRLAFYDEPIPEGHKRCSKCEKILTIDNFTKYSRSRDGRLGVCKKCRYEQYSSWALINREHINDYRRKKGL